MKNCRRSAGIVVCLDIDIRNAVQENMMSQSWIGVTSHWLIEEEEVAEVHQLVGL